MFSQLNYEPMVDRMRIELTTQPVRTANAPLEHAYPKGKMGPSRISLEPSDALYFVGRGGKYPQPRDIRSALAGFVSIPKTCGSR